MENDNSLHVGFAQVNPYQDQFFSLLRKRERFDMFFPRRSGCTTSVIHAVECLSRIGKSVLIITEAFNPKSFTLLNHFRGASGVDVCTEHNLDLKIKGMSPRSCFKLLHVSEGTYVEFHPEFHSLSVHEKTAQPTPTLPHPSLKSKEMLDKFFTRIGFPKGMVYSPEFAHEFKMSPDLSVRNYGVEIEVEMRKVAPSQLPASSVVLYSCLSFVFDLRDENTLADRLSLFERDIDQWKEGG